ncbi:hypothetical protein BCR34DRAFT_597106 [Clohesyomyces aquaticus]|uniref:Uncharacterized protein n=1 Tax=Clohesyomyces aquaticus TaxID=1231657 RepID=A0A1Y2A5K1_9PLEO|nr:hypothetical protein BCR34DRAFT_597106 [Clohesyomyces aquaticus]
MSSNNDCQYNCSKHPYNVPPNPDISGIGVSLGYTITAGIAVLIVILHYVTVYDPTDDVFYDPDDPSNIRREEHKPNPIDVQILRWIPRRKFIVSYGLFSKHGRMQIGLARALLIMSDLQLFTGFAIIISGFSQLHCGISSWHWNRLVYVAWFASITHFACLTSLRGYLHHHKLGRLWRSFVMSILIILITIALVPTGYLVEDPDNTDCGELRPQDGDYMICYFNDALRWRNPYRLDSPAKEKECDNSGTIGIQRWGMVASIMLLAGGMLIRLLKLYPTTSKGLTYGRWQLSIRCVNLLDKVFVWSNAETPWSRLRQTLCYRPLLTIFLSLRLLLDFWLSMAFEVYWLIAGFGWGNGKLFFGRDMSYLVDVQKGEFHNWSFGQIMPLLLLAAPIVAVLEAIEPKGRDAGGNSHAAQSQPPPTPTVSRRPTDYQSAVNTCTIAASSSYPATFNPRLDFYNQFRFMRIATIFLCLNMLSITVFVVLSLWVTGTLLPLIMTHPGAWAWSPIPFGFSIIIYVLYGLVFEDLYASLKFKDKKIGLIVLWAAYVWLNFVFGVIFTVLPGLVFVHGIDMLNDAVAPTYSVSVGLYFLFALVDALVEHFR